MVCESTLHSFSHVVAALLLLVGRLVASQINIDFDGLHCDRCGPNIYLIRSAPTQPNPTRSKPNGGTHIGSGYVKWTKSNKRKRFIKCAQRNSLLGHYFSIQFHDYTLLIRKRDVIEEWANSDSYWWTSHITERSTVTRMAVCYSYWMEWREGRREFWHIMKSFVYQRFEWRIIIQL